VQKINSENATGCVYYFTMHVNFYYLKTHHKLKNKIIAFLDSKGETKFEIIELAETR
jgi:hypothetical protein